MGVLGEFKILSRKIIKIRVWTVWSVGKLVTEDPTLKNKATLEWSFKYRKNINYDVIITSSGQLGVRS